MPNWCEGTVVVDGRPEDIEGFCKLFIFDDSEGKRKERYFARSFIHLNWENFKNDCLKEYPVFFYVEFAWSCYSCMIGGYPQESPNQCLTLSEACKRYKVNVEIETIERSLGFEEHINCNKKGEVTENSENMKDYKCVKCGNVQLIPSRDDKDTEDCYECEHSNGFDEVKE